MKFVGRWSLCVVEEAAIRTCGADCMAAIFAILSRALLCMNRGPHSATRLANGRFRRPRLGSESGFLARNSAMIDLTSTVGPCRPSPTTEFWSMINELAAAAAAATAAADDIEG